MNAYIYTRAVPFLYQNYLVCTTRQHLGNGVTVQWHKSPNSATNDGRGIVGSFKGGKCGNFTKCFEKCTREKEILLPFLASCTLPQRDTLLHVAASYGHEELCAFIAHCFSQFNTLQQQESQRWLSDYALHLAAR